MSVEHAKENASVIKKNNLNAEIISKLEDIYKTNNFYYASLKQKALEKEMKNK